MSQKNSDCLAFALWVAESTDLKELTYAFFSDNFVYNGCGEGFSGKIDKLQKYWELHIKQ